LLIRFSWINLEVNNLTACVEADLEAVIRLHLSAEDDVTFMKNGKSTDKYGPSDSDDDIDNSYI
jgi:hypothetical protein